MAVGGTAGVPRGPEAAVPTWKLAQATDDLQPPLLQRQPVLTHHQGKHDERHKLTGVGLRGKATHLHV